VVGAVLSLAILLATTALAVWIGERIYRNSLLKTGPRGAVRRGAAGLTLPADAAGSRHPLDSAASGPDGRMVR
jgi:hypothetical protein